MTQEWLCALELRWETTPVLPRAPKEAARSKGGGAGARERVAWVKGMGLQSGKQSDAPLPYTGTVGDQSQVLVGYEGKGYELRAHLSTLGCLYFLGIVLKGPLGLGPSAPFLGPSSRIWGVREDP